VIKDSRRVDNLIPLVFILCMTDIKSLSGERIGLNLDIGLGEVVDE
jgi:hypothetical protein